MSEISVLQLSSATPEWIRGSSRKRFLTKTHFPWNNPVTFLGEAVEKVDTSDLENDDAVLPVIPLEKSNGRIRLVALRIADLKHDLAEETEESDDEISSPAEQDMNGTATGLAWNAAPLRSYKSLYRVILTHDFRSREAVKPRGLFNTRNMCFFNSVLQVLVHCTPFYSLLKEIYTDTALGIKSATPVLDALVSFGYRYGTFDISKKAISADDFYDVICENAAFNVQRGRQEDAQEFLGHLLDVLESNFSSAPPTEEDKKDDLLSAKRKAAEITASDGDDGWTEVGQNNRAVETQHAGRQDLENPVQELFGGKMRSTLVKQGRRKPSVTIEPFQQIPVDISADEVKTVQQAIDYHQKEEKLMLGSSAATKHLEFERVPPILIVHLKRFTFIKQGETFDFGKITKPVKIDERLNLTSGGQDVAYKPFGIVYHHGMSATRGHYTADVRINDTWHHIDDQQVVPQEEHAVVGDEDSGGSRSAYMVFYEKINDN